MSNEILIQVKNLKKYFQVKNEFLSKEKKFVKAVDDVSFYIKKGETFGLVGESGCGKSTLGRTITRLYDATEGDIFFEGTNIAKLPKKEMKNFYSKIQTIFQDPYSSLNPNMTVRELINEPLSLHTSLNKIEINNKIKELLEMVGLSEADMDKYPYEFSGGQRQRIGIARALYHNPEFLVMDEATSALDTETEKTIIETIERIKGKKTLLIIAHRISTIKNCDYIYRLKDGKIESVQYSDLCDGE